MATVYRIKSVPEEVIEFTAVVLTDSGEKYVHLKGTVREVSASLQRLVLQPGFRKWRKAG
jgi:hypothetical protein